MDSSVPHIDICLQLTDLNNTKLQNICETDFGRQRPNICHVCTASLVVVHAAVMLAHPTHSVVYACMQRVGINLIRRNSLHHGRLRAQAGTYAACACFCQKCRHFQRRTPTKSFVPLLSDYPCSLTILNLCVRIKILKHWCEQGLLLYMAHLLYMKEAHTFFWGG